MNAEMSWSDRREACRRHEEAVRRDEAAVERERLVGVIESALGEFDCTGGKPWDEVATVALDALIADGVVFPLIGIHDKWGRG